MFTVGRVKWYAAFGTIGQLCDSGRDEVIDMIRYGTIRHGLVPKPEVSARCTRVPRRTYT